MVEAARLCTVNPNPAPDPNSNSNSNSNPDGGGCTALHCALETKVGRYERVPLVTDDSVVLAALEARPEAASEKQLCGYVHEFEGAIESLPLASALQNHRSVQVVAALVEAYPRAVQASVPKIDVLPMAFAASLKSPDAVRQVLLDAYPAALDQFKTAAERLEAGMPMSTVSLPAMFQEQLADDLVLMVIKAKPEVASLPAPQRLLCGERCCIEGPAQESEASARGWGIPACAWVRQECLL